MDAAVTALAVLLCLAVVALLGAGAYALLREGLKRDPSVTLEMRGFPPPQRGDLPLGMVAAAPDIALTLPEEMRTTHQLVLGASGMGKTKALAGWVAHDLDAGHGVIVIDPHEELVFDALALAGDKLPARQPIILSAGDPSWAIGYNPLRARRGMSAYQTAAALIDVFQKVWDDSWGVWMHDYLLHSFWALAATGWTILEVPRFLTDDGFRAALAAALSRRTDGDYAALLEWIGDYDAKTAGQQRQERQSTMVRVRQFVGDPNIRVIIGQRQSSVTFEDILARQVPFFASLSWRALKVNAYLLGALLLSQLQDDVLSAATISQQPRSTTYFYIDEFQEMATPAFIEVLAQARKFGLSVVVSTQSLTPLGPELKAAVKANCRNLSVFQCSADDAAAMAREVFVGAMGQPVGTAEASAGSTFDATSAEYVARLKALRPRQFYLRRKAETRAVLLHTHTIRWPGDAQERVEALREASGRRYGRPRAVVEAELARREQEIARFIQGGRGQSRTGPSPDSVVTIPD